MLGIKDALKQYWKNALFSFTRDYPVALRDSNELGSVVAPGIQVGQKLNKIAIKQLIATALRLPQRE